MSTYLTATGIAVSDLDASTNFYKEILGMVVHRTITLDIMVENILGFEGVRGTAILLMQYHDRRNCKDLPTKLVFNVPDVRGIIETARAANVDIYKEAAEYESMGGSIIALIKDPDGYLIELMQKPAKK